MNEGRGALTYVVGDATEPQGFGPKVIAHVCNDVGGWGKGFVTAISRRWREPEQAYRAWYRAREINDFKLGSVQMIAVADGLWVANVIGQHGIGPASDGSPPVRYEAIEVGLQALAELARTESARVHMPRIGCGLAGGEWSELEPIIGRTLLPAGIDTTVYDLAT